MKFYDKNSDGALDSAEVQALIEHAMSEKAKLPERYGVRGVQAQ